MAAGDCRVRKLFLTAGRWKEERRTRTWRRHPWALSPFANSDLSGPLGVCCITPSGRGVLVFCVSFFVIHIALCNIFADYHLSGHDFKALFHLLPCILVGPPFRVFEFLFGGSHYGVFDMLLFFFSRASTRGIFSLRDQHCIGQHPREKHGHLDFHFLVPFFFFFDRLCTKSGSIVTYFSSSIYTLI